MVYSGPVYSGMRKENGKIYLTFDFVGKGLISKDGKPLTDFTIAGADQQFEPAQAVIAGNQVVVSNPNLSDPQAVRFSWSEQATPNLFNRDGLPAGPFRTDDWPEPKRPEQIWNLGAPSRSEQTPRPQAESSVLPSHTEAPQ